MTDINGRYRLLRAYADVAPLLQAVCAAADEQRNALGFFPRTVFDEYARKEQLVVAQDMMDHSMAYVGHILFDLRFPKAHVLQVHVDDAFRNQGIGTMLVEALKCELTRSAFLSITARVAEDLSGAVAFWQRQGFLVQRLVPGGARRARTILAMCHELSSPQLFASSGISSENPLGLDAVAGSDAPLFLLDLNVLFDLGPRRERNEDILNLFRAERMGACQFVISTEIRAELTRSAAVGRTDPMLDYARIFPAYGVPSDEEWQVLKEQLAALVFPARASGSTLSPQETSDLRHLATAVHHHMSGFITSDGAILAAATSLREQFGVHVVSPMAFREVNSSTEDESVYLSRAELEVFLKPVTPAEEAGVARFLEKIGVTASELPSVWAVVDFNEKVATRYGVWIDGVLKGYATWSKWAISGTLAARLAVNEALEDCIDVSRVLLNQLIEHTSRMGPTRIQLDLPSGQIRAREVAAALGFRGIPSQTTLTKIALNSVATPSNWLEKRGQFISSIRVGLPERLPVFRSPDQQIEIQTPNGNRAYLPLVALEALLSPALLCLSGRPAVMTPVRREYAEHLLSWSSQRSLLPWSRASLFRERHYLSDRRTIAHFRRGSLMFFYESGRGRGAAAVVAVARVVRAYLRPIEAIEMADLNPSVLGTEKLRAIGSSAIKTIAVFDNLFALPRPVPLATLRRLGCGSSTFLLTTRAISDIQAQQILSEGGANDQL